MTNKQLATYLAEGLGTFILATVAMNVSGLVGLVIVGLTLMVLVSVIGGISGAHVNPAVTVGLLSQRKINVNDAIGYIVAQVVGAAVAWKLHEYFIDTELLSSTADFSARIFTGEVIGMAVFAMGIAATVANKFKGMQAAATVGFSLMLGIVVATASGGGVLNPAVALSLQELSTETVLGPLLGSIIGMGAFMWIHESTSAK